LATWGAGESREGLAGTVASGTSPRIDLWWVGRAISYTAMLVLILGYLRTKQQFIYFQF
jgi:hypothetical protein